jgi:hypothetical protein
MLFQLSTINDGEILVGGDFTSYIVTEIGLSVWILMERKPQLNTGMGFNNSVYTIKLQPDGKILIGGLYNIWWTIEVSSFE